MPVECYTALLLFLSLQCWVAEFSAPDVPPPAPLLSQQTSARGAIVLVCQAPSGYKGLHFVLFRVQEQIDQMTLPTAQETAKFTLQGDVVSGQNYYCCQYTTIHGRESLISSYTTLTPSVKLPTPSLFTSKEPSIGLECTGSPAYPGAWFSLFCQGEPEVTRQAPQIQYRVIFPHPHPLHSRTMCQCEYTVQLGREWAFSERSAPLAVPSTTVPSDITPSKGEIDWAMILGSFSAGILFVIALVVMGIIVQRKVKEMARKRREREQHLFWNSMHSRDHIVDLTLPRVSVTSKDSRLPSNGGGSSSDPIYDSPFSTFNGPPT